ncbi:MAG TPA: hypothetical protein DCS48_03935 [Desulfovibrio sp.]|nr:hypothetical protein [Desulfovibrio sp.]
MIMSKKFKAAITVAAIAGTCALSSPSFAAWESDAPTKLGTDIVASAADNTDGIVVVGDDGKAYHMTAAKMLNANTSEIDWTQVYPPASGDFVGVVHVDDMFLAVTSDGTIVVSDNGEKGRWQKHPLSTVLKGLLGDKKLVGLASDLISKAVVITADGSAFYYDHSFPEPARTIIPIKKSGEETGVLAGEAIATNSNVRGIEFLTGQTNTFMVYGAGGGNGNANNLYKITTAGAVEGFNLYNCPAINDFAFPTSGIWYAAGDGGAIVRSDDNLSGAGKNIDDNKLDIPGNFSSNLFSIEYNSDKKLGYASGKSGSLLEISGRDVTVVNQTESQQDLNAVSLAMDGNLKRAFVSGNDGASLYGSQTYWQAALGGMINVCPLFPKTILSLGSKFYSIDGTDNKLYSSTDPATTWKDLSAVYSRAVSPGVSAAASVGGADYVAFGIKAFPDGQYAQGVIFKVKEGEETKATVFRSSSFHNKRIEFMTVLNDGDRKYLCVVHDVFGEGVKYIDIATTVNNSYAAQAAGLFAREVDITGLAASARALYVAEGGKLYVMTTGTGENIKITTVPSAENIWTEIAASKFDDKQVDKLYSATDGTVLFTTTDNKIYIINDDIGGDDNKAIFISPQNWGYNGAKPVSLSGSSNDLVVATVDDVWRSKDRQWEKYGELDDEVTSMAAVDGVASIDEKVLAIDTTNNALAYSVGGVFKVARPDMGPAVGANIGNVYNATKSVVYVAGDQGLLYKGTKGEGATSFTWTDENADVFGAKKIYAVTGIGEHLFVAYKDGAENSYSFATKELGADNWTLLTGKTSGSVSDVKALSDRDLVVIDGGALKHASISGSNVSSFEMSERPGTDAFGSASFAALDIVDAEHLYGVAGKDFYKLTEPTGDVWVSEKIALPEAQNLKDIVVLAADKIYMVGEHGYVVVYDGTSAKKIAAPADVTLSSCWAYEKMLYACDWSGKVHQYNFETEEWSSGIAQNGAELTDITGSSMGGYLFAAGGDNTLVRTGISSSGGGETNTTVHPGHGEEADLVLRTVEEDRTPEELTSTNKTPAMEVVGHVETFTTKPGLVVGSVHNFNFSVTPATDTPVADLHLFKLLAANGGSNIEYERQDSIPAAATNGVFWVTDGGGNVMSTSDTLLANTVYTVNFGVKDGGEYDSDGAADGVIIDPVVLGNTGSSSGGSGCVFNPAQTFGLEWLMLAFAPLAAFFRSRFKK